MMYMPACGFVTGFSQPIFLRWFRCCQEDVLTTTGACRSMRYALNSAILLHTSAKQYDAASQIYRRMCTVGPQPDTVTINTLLAACANAGRLSQALKLFDELRDRGACRCLRLCPPPDIDLDLALGLITAACVETQQQIDGKHCTVHIHFSLAASYCRFAAF